MAKKKSKRSEAKYRNYIVAGIRTSFARYHPKYQEIVDRQRREQPRYKKDGSESLVKDVSHECEKCGELVKEFDIDHKEPVIELGKSYTDYTLDELEARINCNPLNLWLICVICHDEKTALEKKIATEIKKQKKGKT